MSNAESKVQGYHFYGWWLLIFLWIVYTLPIGFALYSPAVLYPSMIQELQWTRGGIMVGSTAIMLLFGLASPLAAWLIDHSGARVTIVIGGLITALAAFLICWAGHIYPIYVFLCLSLGLGVCLSSMIPVQTVVIAWFHTRRALALGLVLAGGGIGGFLAPRFITWLVMRTDDNWRLGWAIIGAASLIGALVAIFAVRNRPTDMGQHPDGKPVYNVSVNSPKTVPSNRPYRTSHAWTFKEAIGTRSLWFLIIAITGSFFLWQIIVTQGPLHLEDRGFTPEKSAGFYSLAFLWSLVGRLIIAVLGDRIEPRFLFVIGSLCILTGGIIFWNVNPGTMWTAYLYPLLAGFGFGIAYVCIPTITGNYWGPEVFAKLSGLISPIVLIVQGIAAPIAGGIYDLYKTYLPVMAVAWILASAGFVAMLLCLPPKPSEVCE